jgi:hypothetical protein
VLVVIVNFLSSNWEPKHVTIGLFEATTTYGATMVSKLHDFFDKFSLIDKILTYVKDEGVNLQSCGVKA